MAEQPNDKRPDIRGWAAARLLEELKADVPPQWFFISLALGDEFLGGFYVKARGKTEAWMLLHNLNWWQEGASTITVGPLPDDEMDARVPPEYRWRRLTQEEVEEADHVA